MNERMRKIANLSYLFEQAVIDGRWDEARDAQRQLRAMDLTGDEEGQWEFRSYQAVVNGLGITPNPEIDPAMCKCQRKVSFGVRGKGWWICATCEKRIN